MPTVARKTGYTVRAPTQNRRPEIVEIFVGAHLLGASQKPVSQMPQPLLFQRMACELLEMQSLQARICENVSHATGPAMGNIERVAWN